MRELAVTSIYLPKNAMGCSKSGWLNTKRYVPPVRTSASQETNDIPNEGGAHHRLSNSGLVQASNTTCAGALKVRVTTISRSDIRSAVVGVSTGSGSLSFACSISFLPLQIINDLVQLAETGVPELAVPLDPCRLFLQPAHAELARPHPPDFFRGDEPRLFQDADVLLHAREGHTELPGKLRDRRVRMPQPFQDAASGGVRERGERGIQRGALTLNHTVHYKPAERRMQGASGQLMPECNPRPEPLTYDSGRRGHQMGA